MRYCVRSSTALFALAPVCALIVFLASQTNVKAQDDVIHESCKKDLQMTDSECDCVLSAVNETLNENQLAFFVASIKQDQSAMIAAQGNITQDEMMELANLMTTTPTNCKGK